MCLKQWIWEMLTWYLAWIKIMSSLVLHHEIWFWFHWGNSKKAHLHFGVKTRFLYFLKSKYLQHPQSAQIKRHGIIEVSGMNNKSSRNEISISRQSYKTSLWQSWCFHGFVSILYRVYREAKLHHDNFCKFSPKMDNVKIKWSWYVSTEVLRQWMVKTELMISNGLQENFALLHFSPFSQYIPIVK